MHGQAVEEAAGDRGAAQPLTRIDIDPSLIMPTITGKELLLEGHIAVCDGIAIARRVDDASHVEVHCAHPRHGTHPRYGELASKIATLRYGAATSGPCPICRDRLWLPMDSQEARMQTMLAWGAGYFRGVALPERQRRPRARAMEVCADSAQEANNERDAE